MNPDQMPDVGEDVDLTLRHISRQFPEDFARALLPPGTRVTSAIWLDTQVTSRQRRLDRALDVVADDQRRLEHMEWQLRWESDVPFRVHEYHNLMVVGLAAEIAAKEVEAKGHPRPTAGAAGAAGTVEIAAELTAMALPVPIRSTLVLLTGREKPWPEEGSYRTSPDGAPFSGVTFRIDAVYQRTVAELEARGSPLWLVFAPLAVDADEQAMQRVVALLRRRASGRAFEELAAALVVMADVDKRRRGLRDAIIRSLNEETLMESWLYKQGEEKGFKKGEEKGLEKGLEKGFKKGEEKGLEKGLEKGAARSLRALFVRRIGREPTPDEEQALTRRAHGVSPEQLVELFDMPASALVAWLAAP